MTTTSRPAGEQDFRDRYGPRALILGGSEGIGAAFAAELAARGLDLTLVARTSAALEATATALRAQHRVDVSTQLLDLTGPDVEATAAGLFARQEFGLVVYNAGATHGVGRFAEQPLAKALNLVRLNCAGPVVIAHHALHAMRSRRRGGVILMSSMSALAGSGFVATYAASKSFDMVLAEGLHWEARHDGIDVMCCVAGLTDTPAMRRSGLQMDADPNYVAMDPVAVASGALANLGRVPVWFAVGDAPVQAMRAMPREQLSDVMSRASARLYGIALD